MFTGNETSTDLFNYGLGVGIMIMASKKAAVMLEASSHVDKMEGELVNGSKGSKISVIASLAIFLGKH